MSLEKRTLFLTGITGTLGKELLRAFLKETPHKLFLLIRRKNRFSHWDRARKILAAYGLESYLGTRVQVMQGDVTMPRLGLVPEDFEILKREAQDFYHVAALTTLNGSKENCYSVNFGGTLEALQIAQELRQDGRLEKFIYFSTAFVAGSRQTYKSMEDGLPVHPAHANYYEESKYAAESKVREAIEAGLPGMILRPSIIVGDSKTGEVSEFNVIYPFMKLFAHGILSKLPTHPENSFNIVPIDFVVKAALAITQQKESLGKTFHLVTQEPPTIGMLLRIKDEDYPLVPTIQVLDPASFKREELSADEQMVFDMLEPYLGYLNDHLTFDTTNTRKALEGTGISFPKTDYAFLRTLCRYAVKAGYLVTS